MFELVLREYNKFKFDPISFQAYISFIENTYYSIQKYFYIFMHPYVKNNITLFFPFTYLNCVTLNIYFTINY